MARGKQPRAGAAPADSVKMVEIEAIEPIKAGRTRHAPGAVFPVSVEEAEKLKAIGHACEPGSRTPQAQADAPPTAGDQQPQGDLLPPLDPA